jgi:LmbE family N-acetylglucosaminyl deacetylase
VPVSDDPSGAADPAPAPTPGGPAPTTGELAVPAEGWGLPTPARALAVGAHPDDIEFGAGATLARWAAAGCVVNHLICTDGSKGTWDPSQDVAELVHLRQDEQRAAATALGATGEVAFLGWPDGELESGLRQRWQVA